MAERVPVDLEMLRDHLLQVEPLGDERGPVRSEFGQARWITQQPGDGVDQPVDVADVAQDARGAVGDRVNGASCPRRDHRAAEVLRLQQDVGCALESRRQQQQLRGAEDHRHVVAPAEQVEAIGPAGVLDGPSHLVGHHAAADDDRVQHGDQGHYPPRGLDEGQRVLFGAESQDARQQPVGALEPQFFAQGRDLFRRRWADRLEVEAVVDHLEPLDGQTEPVGIVLRAGVRVVDQSHARRRRKHRVEPVHVRVVQVRQVRRVDVARGEDHHRDVGQQCRHAAPDVRVVEPGVEDVRRVGHEFAEDVDRRRE